MNPQPNNSDLYSIIRSNNTKLFQGWLKVIQMGSSSLYELLSTTYDELRLKNVPISRNMQFEVEWKLAELQFVVKDYIPPDDDLGSFTSIKKHLDFTTELIESFLNNYFKRTLEVTSLSFIEDAKRVASHISVLKRQLDFSYKKIPWEEMEFCLVQLVLTFMHSKDSELTYELVLDKERVLSQLNYFSKQLSDVQDWFQNVESEHSESDSKLLREINKKFEQLNFKGQMKGRIGNKHTILKNSPQFENLFEDFGLLRDVYSLNRMTHYLKVVLSADLDEEPIVGTLVIQRALQVIGEFLKNEKDSPNISDELYEVLIKLVATNLKSTSANLRNMLSHTNVLNKRLELEASTDKNIFKKIQANLKTINSELTRVLYKRKIDALKMFLQKLLNCTQIEEMTNIFQHVSVDKLDEFKPIELPNLSHLKDLIAVFWEQVKDDVPEEDSIDPILKDISYYEDSLEEISSKYIQGIKALHQMLKSKQFDKTKNIARTYLGILNTSDLKGVFEQGIFGSLHIIYKSFKESRGIEINDTSSTDKKLIEVTKVMTKIHDNLKWEIQRISGLEEMDSILSTENDLFEKVQKQLHPNERALFERCVNDSKDLHLKKLKLLKFMKRDTFKEILTSMNLDKEVESKILTSHKKKKYGDLKQRITGYIPDAYGRLKTNLEKLRAGLFPLQDYFEYLTTFYKALGFIKTLLEKVIKLSQSIIVEGIEMDYNRRLATLKTVRISIGDFKIIEPNESVVSALEMLVLDLTEFIEQMNRLDDHKTFLVEKLPMLNGKQLRNHLAHNNMITLILPYNTYVPLLYYSQGLIDLDDKIITQKDSWVVGFRHQSGNDDMYNYSCRSQNIVKLQDELFRCGKEGHAIDKIALLLKSGADIFARDAAGYSMLDLAVRNNNQTLVDFLLSVVRNEKLNIFQFISPYTATSSYEIFSYLLENSDLNINFVDEYNNSLLHVASEIGEPRIVQFLFKNITQNSSKNILGETALHLASRKGHTDIVSFLLEHNQDLIDQQTHNGASALHMATDNGYGKILNHLIKRGANISLTNSEGFTAFELAVRNGNDHVINEYLPLFQTTITNEEKTKAFMLASQYGHYTITGLMLENLNLNEKLDEAAYMAAVFGHVNITQMLLNRGANINAKHVNDNTLLHVASQFSHVEMANMLLNNKASVNARNKAFWTPLHFAFQNSNLDMINSLISKGAEVNSLDISGLAPYHVAAECGSIGSVRFFLQTFPENVNLPTEIKLWTALHLAAGQGKLEIVQLLIKKGADANLQAADKSTPLHWAIQRHGYTNIVNALLPVTSVNSQDMHGATPLHAAVLNQNEDIVDLLLEHKANAEMPNNSLYTPLHVAAMYWNSNIVKMLLEKINDVDLRNHVLQTPLHIAATEGCLEIVKLLVDHGANYLLDENKVSALHHAAYKGHLDVVMFLVEHRHEICGHDNLNRSPLYMAISQEHEDIALYLIDKGADTREQITDDVSILSSSIKKGMFSVVAKVIELGVDINSPYCSSRITPLLIALLGGHEIIALFLLAQEGIDINHSTTSGWTALHVACGRGFTLCVDEILRFNPNVNVKTTKGETPLYFASEKGHNNIVIKLINHGALVDEMITSNLPTALCCAVRNGHKDVVATLLAHNADANVKCKSQTTPLHMAILCEYTDMAVIILQCNRTDISAQTDNKWTALHFAAQKGNLVIISILLERNVSDIINLITDEGITALHLAAHNGNKEIAELLIRKNANTTVRNAEGLTAKDIALIKGFNDIAELCR